MINLIKKAQSLLSDGYPKEALQILNSVCYAFDNPIMDIASLGRAMGRNKLPIGTHQFPRTDDFLIESKAIAKKLEDNLEAFIKTASIVYKEDFEELTDLDKRALLHTTLNAMSMNDPIFDYSADKLPEKMPKTGGYSINTDLGLFLVTISPKYTNANTVYITIHSPDNITDIFSFGPSALTDDGESLIKNLTEHMKNIENLLDSNDHLNAETRLNLRMSLHISRTKTEIIKNILKTAKQDEPCED